MPKFEAKREIFKKIGKNWGGGGYSPPASPALPPMRNLSNKLKVAGEDRSATNGK